MKRLWLAVSEIALGLSAVGAITYDGKVLDGEWLLNGSDDVLVRGSLSGTGDIRFQQTQGYLSMECNNTSVGNIYNDWGLFYVNTAASLGSATVYVNDETTSGRAKSVYLWRSMTVLNPMVLGSERTANWGPRLRINKSITVALNGPISVNDSKIAVEQKSKVTVSGGISGNKVVLSAESEAAIDIVDKPMSLTGAFWAAGSGSGTPGTISLNVDGNVLSGIYGFGGVTMKVGVDHPFATPVPFAPQKDKAFTIDLNGHNMDLGSCANEGAGYGDTSACTIVNSTNFGTLPTVSVNQVNDNVGVNGVGAAVGILGRINFTKKGAGILMPQAFNIQDGTLRVEDGAFRLLVAATSTHLANTVVVAGGTLDLNGGSFSCYRLEQRGGKIINGKLTVRDANVLYSDTEVSAEIVGKTVKPSGTEFLYANALAVASPMPYTYKLPEGAVFYMPFDTAETLCFDYGSCGTDVFVGAGTPDFAAEGKTGGCLYVDGASHLEARGGVPAGFPVGAAPVTVSCWIKPASDCSTRGGWFSYGGTASGRGSSYTLTGSFENVKWYANDSDVYTAAIPTLLDGAWHHVVGVWDGEYRDVYVDGIRYVHQANKPLNTDTAVFMIGKTMWDHAFKGWIDEVLVLDRAATAAEVSALYSGGVSRAEESFSEVTIGAGSVNGGSGALAVAYPFDSPEAFLQDVSRTGATLANNGAIYSSDSAFGSGGSAYFDGSSSFLSLASFPSAIPSSNKARTLLCFAKPESNMPKEGAFISYGNEGWDSGKYMNFAFRDSSGSAFGLFPWGADNVKATGLADVIGNWQSFAAVWDGSKVTLYHNGTVVFGPTAFEKSVIPNTTAANFKIGKAWYNGTSFFKGNLDEVAVCNRALTAAEIAAYAQSGIEALMAKPLAGNTALTLESGAVLATPHTAQTIAALGGVGSIVAKALTVTQKLSGSVSVSGDLTLGDGVVIRAGAAPTVVSGQVTIAGGGTILMPDNLPKQGAVTLIRAGSFAGTENLSDCTFSNLPNRMIAKLKIRNGNELILTWSMPGLLVILR